MVKRKGEAGGTKPGFAPSSATVSLGDLGQIPSLPRAQASNSSVGATSGPGYPRFSTKAPLRDLGMGHPKSLGEKHIGPLPQKATY